MESGVFDDPRTWAGVIREFRRLGLGGLRGLVAVPVGTSRMADMGLVCALLVPLHRRTGVPVEATETGDRDHPGRSLAAVGTGRRLRGTRKGTDLIEGSMFGAFKFVQWHGDPLTSGTAVPEASQSVDDAGFADELPTLTQVTLARSALVGMEIFGPFALGRMSKLKISLGIARVAQALGISTMPLIRPSTGAVPRMA